jgi:MFS family permease
MFGIFLFVTLYLQNVLGYSPTEAGATFLPMTILIVIFAPIAGRLSDRIGSRWLMAGGLLLISLSLLLDTRFTATSTFWDILPPLVLGGIGMGFAMTPTTAAAMGSVPVDKAGVGSAVLNSMRQVGGSLGIAVLGAIVASYVTVEATDPRLQTQFLDGFHAALYVASAIAFAGALVAIATVRKVAHPEASALAEAA